MSLHKLLNWISRISKILCHRFGKQESDRIVKEALALASAHRGKQEWSEAAQQFRRVLKLCPMRPDIWVQLGHAAKESGDHVGARQAYEEGARLEPDNAETQLHLGHLLKNEGHFREAGLAFATCLKTDPEVHDAYDQLLHIGWSRSDILSAIPLLREVRRSAGERLALQPVSSFLLFEAIKQMTRTGNQVRHGSSQGQ